MSPADGHQPTSDMGLPQEHISLRNPSSHATDSQPESRYGSAAVQSHLDVAKSATSPIINISKDLNALILQQMRATPDLVALEDEKVTFTYAELDQKVSVLAKRLCEQGVTRDSLVGVLLGRSAD
jgi:non-ribosomal peptide synthetase component F